MFAVKLSDAAIKQLMFYTELYRDGYLNLYCDSGIWSEQIICERYIQLSQELFDDILESIRERLSVDIILGRKEDRSKSEIVFRVQDRLVSLLFTEDKKTKVRIIVFVSIDRKYIAF